RSAWAGGSGRAPSRAGASRSPAAARARPRTFARARRGWARCRARGAWLPHSRRRRSSSARKDLDVAQERVLRYRDLVLDQEAAVRAAELAELRQRVDEARGVADERVRGLDRQVVAHAIGLVVVADGAKVLRAFRAAVVLVAVDGERFGGEEERLALELADRLRVGLSLHAPRAQLVPPAPGRRLVAGHD